MEYNFTLDHVLSLKLHCFEAHLSMPERFRFASGEQLQACYNGIGPDRWSSCFRRFTTWVLMFLEASALIHDWEYEYQEKTYWAFTVANLRLAWNASLDRHPVAGVAAAVLCQLFGWKGYKQAHPQIPAKKVDPRMTGEEADRKNLEILSKW